MQWTPVDILPHHPLISRITATAAPPDLFHRTCKLCKHPRSSCRVHRNSARPCRDCAAATTAPRPRLRSAYSPILAAMHALLALVARVRTAAARTSKPPAMCCASHPHAHDLHRYPAGSAAILASRRSRDPRPTSPPTTRQPTRMNPHDPHETATQAHVDPPTRETPARPRASPTSPRRDSIATCPHRRSRPSRPVRPG